MILTDETRSPTEVLMESLSRVEKAKRVIILIEREDSLNINSNCSYRDIKWILDQATHVVMNELFGIAEDK